MPGTVTDVSATFVASTTRWWAWGLNAFCWSCTESRLKSGSTSTFGPRRPSSTSFVSRISRSPLRKTSTSPSPSARSSSTASPIWSTGSAAATGSPSSPTGSEVQRTSTGYVRPLTSTTGAPPKCSAKRPGSIVALVMMSLRSGRRGSRSRR